MFSFVYLCINLYPFNFLILFYLTFYMYNNTCRMPKKSSLDLICKVLKGQLYIQTLVFGCGTSVHTQDLKTSPTKQRSQVLAKLYLITRIVLEVQTVARIQVCTNIKLKSSLVFFFQIVPVNNTLAPYGKKQDRCRIYSYTRIDSE